MLLRHVAYCLGVHEVLRFNVPAPAHSFFQDHLEALQERGAEGFVLRHRSAAYTPGRPNSGGTALKVKFWKDVTCGLVRGGMENALLASSSSMRMAAGPRLAM